MPSQVVQPGDGWALSDGGVGPVVVVLVYPCWQSGEPGRLGAVELLERPALGAGGVGALDLAVGLRAVRRRPPRVHRELDTGVAPQVGTLGRSVPGQAALNA